MDPSTTILRVKRKRGTDPADALLLACKRIRAESSAAPPASNSASNPNTNTANTDTESALPPRCDQTGVESTVFKLVATVASQDAPVQTHVREALSRPRLAHVLRPSQGSAQRIIGDLRSTKWSTRRDERYRILSSHRTKFQAETITTRERQSQESTRQTETEPCLPLGDVQVFDIVHEDEDDETPDKNIKSEPEKILCNSVKMIREKLAVSTDGVGTEHREKESDYVYDLYYQETATPGWIQDILSVRPYTEEGELVPEEVAWEEEVYDDEDDENEERNWRNDYPDEEDSDDNSDAEERYGGCWSEEHSYSRRSWERYRREMVKELEDEDEDEDRDDYNSD